MQLPQGFSWFGLISSVVSAIIAYFGGFWHGSNGSK